jgi:hypothetical protein
MERIKMNKTFLKYTLLASFCVMVFTTFGYASELELKQCEDEALAFGDGSGKDVISQKCYQEFKKNVPDKAKKDTADGSKTVFGYRNLIVIEKKNDKGAVTNIDVIAGVSTLLVSVQAISLDEKNNEIVVLEASGDILFFSSVLAGNMAPFRILRSKELHGATNIVINTDKNEVIAYLPSAGQLLFFSRTANFYGREGRKSLGVLRSIENISSTIHRMNIDSHKSDLLLEEIDEKTVHKISL